MHANLNRKLREEIQKKHRAKAMDMTFLLASGLQWKNRTPSPPPECIDAPLFSGGFISGRRGEVYQVTGKRKRARRKFYKEIRPRA
jgi:hypothetical protein